MQEVRALVGDAPEGLLVAVTGPGGVLADFTVAFGETDGLLVVVTASVVAVILLLVYRSPVLPVVVLLGAVLAPGTASALVTPSPAQTSSR